MGGDCKAFEQFLQQDESIWLKRTVQIPSEMRDVRCPDPIQQDTMSLFIQILI